MTAESSAGGLWATVREALRGSHHDYTSGPLGRAIVLLAIPMVSEMIMESVFAVADVFWVAHLGADAIATVGLTESLLTLIYTAAMGLSTPTWINWRVFGCGRFPSRSSWRATRGSGPVAWRWR